MNSLSRFTAGAITGGAAGFAFGVFLFLDETLGWKLVAHPYLASFLHRSILVWFFAAITMVVVSLLTAPPPAYKVEGNVFASAAEVGETDYRIWAGVLFVCTLILWWTFRRVFIGFRYRNVPGSRPSAPWNNDGSWDAATFQPFAKGMPSSIADNSLGTSSLFFGLVIDK